MTKPKPKKPSKSKTVLVLRTCNADMQSTNQRANGFKWPKRGYVECSDWDPEPKCGQGLHGLLMGEGSHQLLSDDDSAKWLVVEVVASEVVKLSDNGLIKCKFPRGWVVYAGDKEKAIAKILERHPAAVCVFVNKSGGDRAVLSGGGGSTLSGGDYSTLSGGDNSTLSGGYGSTLSGGYGSTLSGGYRSKLSGGNYSTLSGGGGSTLSGGYGSTLSGGYRSKLSGGNYSTLSGGDNSTLSGGYGSTLSGGYGSTLSGGGGSVLICDWWEIGKRYVATAVVGQDGIDPNTWYRVIDGKFTEVDKTEAEELDAEIKKIRDQK